MWAGWLADFCWRLVRGGVALKLVIDLDECIGDGICEAICPEVFELRDDGLAYVINENPAADLKEKIDKAIEECPVMCIRWEE